MRWIFLTLLVLNAAYFSHHWYLTTQEVPVVSVEQSPSVRKGARLTLLSELPDPLPRRLVNEAVESAPTSEPILHEDEVQAGQRLVCTSVGPFNAGVTADNLRQRLLVFGFESKVQEVQIEAEPDYWVFMPPYAGREEALREVRRLHQEGVDSYVIGEGDVANGISLGLFSQEESAALVRDRVAELGYDAEVKIVERFDQRFWVVLDGYEEGALSDDIWDQLQVFFGFAERRDQLCATAERTEVLDSIELE